MTEGAIIMLAHVTETVCEVSCSTNTELLADVLVCDTSPDSTSLKVNFWTLRR